MFYKYITFKLCIYAQYLVATTTQLYKYKFKISIIQHLLREKKVKCQNKYIFYKQYN